MATQEQLRAHTGRAVAALARGALDEAATEFSHAIDLDPRDVMLRQRLADLLARMGRKAEAIAQFQQMAGHYAARGELLRAIAISRTILDLDPAHVETQQALAQLYAKRSGKAGPKTLPPNMSASAVATAQLGPRDDDGSTALTEPELKPLTAADLARTPGDGAPPAPLPGQGRSAEVDLSHAQRTPLFSMLDEIVFAAVIEKIVLRWVKAGEVVVREGEPGSSMFVVVQGEMEVRRGASAIQAGTPTLATIGEGSFFGEMAMVGNSPRLATVVARTDGLLFEIGRDALGEVARKRPGVEKLLHDFYQERLLANLLAVSPIFRAFSDEERRRIGARFVLRSLPAGTHILEQNREGAGLFCVLRGQVQPVQTTDDGVEHAYAPLREGDVFGEISLLFGTLCTATVRALTHVEVLELPAPAFKELVLPHQEVRAMIDRLARARLASTTDEMLASGQVMETWLV